MQADRFTIKSQEAVAAAQRLAAQRRNPEVLCEHLLVALLEQEDGFAPAALRKLSADVAQITSRANQAVDALPTVSGAADSGEGPAVGRPLIAAIQRAEQEMTAFGDEYISVGHLLLALADDDASTHDLLPDRASLAKAVMETQGSSRVTSPNAEEMAEALEKFGRDLTADARQNKLDPVIGRDEEILSLIHI